LGVQVMNRIQSIVWVVFCFYSFDLAEAKQVSECHTAVAVTGVSEVELSIGAPADLVAELLASGQPEAAAREYVRYAKDSSHRKALHTLAKTVVSSSDAPLSDALRFLLEVFNSPLDLSLDLRRSIFDILIDAATDQSLSPDLFEQLIETFVSLPKRVFYRLGWISYALYLSPEPISSIALSTIALGSRFLESQKNKNARAYFQSRLMDLFLQQLDTRPDFIRFFESSLVHERLHAIAKLDLLVVESRRSQVAPLPHETGGDARLRAIRLLSILNDDLFLSSARKIVDRALRANHHFQKEDTTEAERLRTAVLQNASRLRYEYQYSRSPEAGSLLLDSHLLEPALLPLIINSLRSSETLRFSFWQSFLFDLFPDWFNPDIESDLASHRSTVWFDSTRVDYSIFGNTMLRTPYSYQAFYGIKRLMHVIDELHKSNAGLPAHLLDQEQRAEWSSVILLIIETFDAGEADFLNDSEFGSLDPSNRCRLFTNTLLEYSEALQ